MTSSAMVVTICNSGRMSDNSCLIRAANTTLETHGSLDFTVQHQHQSRAHSAESVSSGTLEQGSGALFLNDLPEAVNSSGVHPLGLGLLRLHLQTSADSIEGVRSITSSDSSNLGDGEFRTQTNKARLLSVRIDAGQRVVHTEVHTSVGDDTSDGDTEAVIQTHETRGTLGSLDQTISQAVEGLSTSTDVRSKSGTSIVQRIDDGQRTSTSKTTGSHVDQKEHTELSLGVVSGEQSFDGILEGEVESLSGEITDHVGEVTSPESTKPCSWYTRVKQLAIPV